MSMGMMMLPPIVVSLPFKLIFFVLVDGWSLVAGSLVQSYGGEVPPIFWGGGAFLFSELDLAFLQDNSQPTCLQTWAQAGEESANFICSAGCHDPTRPSSV